MIKTKIITLEADVKRIRARVNDMYNKHRDAMDDLFDAEQELAEARRNA